MNTLEVKATAKINIGLNIVSKRDDGFHNLETVFYQINDLFDLLSFEKSQKLELVVDNKAIDGENIVLIAIKLLEEKCNTKIIVKINLTKNIPIGAGLGGGSSDGASTLMAIDKLFNLKLTNTELKALALQLGSDVPLFLVNHPTIGKSRGEHLENISLKINRPILLVNPGIHISTKDAFTNITPKKNDFDYSDISTMEISQWKDVVQNDFEIGVFTTHPKIKEIKETMLNNGAIFSLMSGTGSTVYGIFDNYKVAEKVSSLFPKSYFTFIGNR